MSGMDRHTGRSISGWDHIRQSLEVILTTRLRTRVERREFGSEAPNIQDRPSNPEVVVGFYANIAEAIDRHEPRVELLSLNLAEADENGDARLTLNLAVVADQSQRALEFVL